MATTEEKLFSLLQVADRKVYSSKAALARDIADAKLPPFGYLFKGEQHSCSPGAIIQYISLAQSIGVLTDELQPFARMQNAYLGGFQLTLSERVITFSVRENFNHDKISRAVNSMIRKRPAQIPSLRNVYVYLNLQCGFAIFRRIVLMRSYIGDTNFHTGLRQVMIIPRILEG